MLQWWHNQHLGKVIQAEMLKGILQSQYFRTWVIVSTYVLLYFMYANNHFAEPKARTFGWLINLNQIFLVIAQALLSLEWYFQAQNTPQKTLFLSFSIFCLLRLLYRLVVLILDRSLISMTPQYFMMLFIVLVLLFLERKYGRD